MDLKTWLSLQPKQSQLRVFRRMTAFLSTPELADVMEGVRSGESLFRVHDRLGLLDKYRNELLRICARTVPAESASEDR